MVQMRRILFWKLQLFGTERVAVPAWSHPPHPLHPL